MTTRTPEQIADAIIFVDAKAEPPSRKVNDDVVAAMMGDGQALRRLIVTSAREAQTPPAFKPEGEPDYYRSQWERIESQPDSDFMADEYMLRINSRDTRNGTIARIDVLEITSDQAKRFLQVLSSEASE